jgi:uncharacterized membrane protein
MDTDTDIDERRRAGLHRFLTFADAVVAIAATLLVLPLVETASDMGGKSVHHLLSDDGHRLLAFALSFGVIWRFWLVHHTMYEHVIDYTRQLLWCNYLFLFGLVFLPFPTEILGIASDKSIGNLALYIGTLTVVTVANVGQQWIITRTPALQAPDVRGSLTIIPTAVSAVAMCLALIVAVTVPVIGIWSLLILAASSFVEKWLLNRRPDAVV